jgi:hypothetical protein
VAGFKTFFSVLKSGRRLATEQGFKSLGDWELRAAGLNEQEGELVGQAADAYGELESKFSAAIAAHNTKYPDGESLWVPWPPEFRQLDLEQKKSVAASVRLLRKQLGEDSFKKLDGYVASRYGGPLRPWRFSDGDVYWRYFYYIANLDRFALRDQPEDLQEGPLRVREQRKAHLNHQQWEALVQVAKQYEQTVKEQVGPPVVQVGLQGVIPGGIGAAQPAPAAQPVLAPQPALAVQPTSSVTPSAVQPPHNSHTLILPPTLALPIASAKEWNEKKERVTSEYLAQLKSKLGPAAFKTLDSYVQRSYNSFTNEEPAARKNAATKTAKARPAAKSQ